MQLFSHYIEPMISWLQYNPHWALFFTFLVSFSESLAIIGSIIPGSITMTAIGILAGTGVMRVDLTLIAAILGAIAGDSISYLIGYTFRDSIISIWPFKRYPNLLTYGKDYFKHHGGKSVLIGRFVGPLRSIIPVIAGMMGMSQWRFFIANFISAIGWSLLYVLPGVLIGAASSELSPESAARLLVVVLLLLGLIWLFSVVLKWIIVRVNRLLRISLHDFWSWSSRHPHLASIISRLTPANESNHYQTAGLCLVFLVCLLCLLIISFMVYDQKGLFVLNQPVHLFLQSLRGISFDSFFIILVSVISPINLLAVCAGVFIIYSWQHNWRQAAYWINLHLSCALLMLFIHWLIPSARPEGLLNIQSGNSYPSIGLSFATAQYTMLMYFSNDLHKNRVTRTFNSLAISVLILAGFGTIYLGDHWLTDILSAYMAGLGLSTIHWLFYRRKISLIVSPLWLRYFLLGLILAGTLLRTLLHHDQEIKNHQPYYAQYVFTDDRWWNQTAPLLPAFRTNRIGKPIALFNVQYAGSINHLEEELARQGWRKQNDSLFYALLKRFSKNYSTAIPLMAPLYLNRKPVLVMTFKPGRRKPMLILRMWRSNFHLKSMKQPLWLGTLESHQPPKLYSKEKTYTINILHFPLYYMSKSLHIFPQKQIKFNLARHQGVEVPKETVILIIKDLPQRIPEGSEQKL